MVNSDNTPVTTSESDRGWQRKAALFLSSQGLSLFGSMLVQYAIIWHLTLTTQSGLVLTIATIAGFLPQIVISLFAGVWADRYPRKRLIILSDALTATSTLLLAIIFLLGYREIWLLIAVSAVRAVGAGIQMPAVSAFLPQIVPQDRLLKVNSINGTLQPFISIAAPLVAGTLLSVAGLEYIFFIDVVTAALAIGLLLLLRVPPHEKATERQTTGYFDDLRQGFAYIGGHPSIKRLFVFFGFVFFLVTPVAFLSPLLVARSFGEEVWRLTANEIAFFAGSIIGGVIMTAWGGFKSHFKTIGLAAVLWGVLFAALGLTNNFWVYLGIMTLSGLPMPMFNVPVTTMLQERVTPDMQGRVFGVMSLITSAVMPVGMVIFGPLADYVSIELLLVISGALLTLPGLAIYLSRDDARGLRSLIDCEAHPEECMEA
jgi:DHA3 family macrolide efflux protein-like MFS transporter